MHRLSLGSADVGSGALAAVRILDPAVPAHALTVTVDARGQATVAAPAGAGVLLERAPLAGAAPWYPGQQLAVGFSLLELAVYEPPDAALEPAEDGGGLDFNRPPRLLPPDAQTRFQLPVPPTRDERRPLPILMAIVPVVMGVGMTLLLHEVYMLAMCVMSPVLMVGNHIADGKRGRRSFAQRTAEFRDHKARIEQDAAAALGAERQRRMAAAPDPAATATIATGPRRRLWERRGTDPDYLLLRLGTADLPSAVELQDPAQDEHRRTVVWNIRDAPVTVPLAERGVLGVAGPGDEPRALGRWLVAQIAVLHSPNDVQLCVLTDSSGQASWEWARWLPHAQQPGGGGAASAAGALIGNDAETVGARIAELLAAISERQKILRESAAPASTGLRFGSIVVVLDGSRRLRWLPGVLQVLRDGPACGVYAICLDAEERLLPAECHAVAVAERGGLRVQQMNTATLTGVRPDATAPDWCTRLARGIAPIRDISTDESSAGLPESSRLLDVLGLEPPDAAVIATRWRAMGRSTLAVVGEAYDGPFGIDIRRDGPHGLIAGTTGSGKSELLQTIVAALAVANRPDAMTFVLIDYKGGSAFKDCVRLPHTVGMVTDLDPHLVERALASLSAELTRREHILAGAGAKDIEDYTDLQERTARRRRVRAAAPPDDRHRRVRVDGQGPAGLRHRPGQHRAAGPVAGHPPAAGHPAAVRRSVPGDPGQHEPADRAAGDRHRGERGRDRRPGRRAHRQVHAGPGVRPPRAFLAGAVPGRPGRRPPPGRGGGHHPAAVAGPAGLGGARQALAAAAGQRPRRGSRDHRPDCAGPRDLPGQRVDAAAGPRTPVAARAAGHSPAERPARAAAAGRWAAPGDPVRPRRPARSAGPAARRAEPGLVRAHDGGRRAAQRPVPAAAHDGRRGRAAPPRSGRAPLWPGLRQRRPAAHRRPAALRRGRAAHPARAGHPADVPAVPGAVPAAGTPGRRRVRGRRRAAGRGGQRGRAAAAHPDPARPLGGLHRRAGRGRRRAPDRDRHKDPGRGRQRGPAPGDDRGPVADRRADLLADRRQDGAAAAGPGRRQPGRAAAAGPARQHPARARVPGRAGVETQVALLAEDASGVGQATALREIATAAAARATGAGREQRPFRVDVLPARLSFADAWPLRDPAVARSPLWALVGVGGDDLAALGPDLADGVPSFIVGGPAKSGRSSVLLAMARSLLAAGTGLVIAAPRPSPLRALDGRPGVAAVFTGSDLTAEELTTALSRLAGPAVVMIDDAEGVRDCGASDELRTLVAYGGDQGRALIFGGNAEDLCSGFGGWQVEARKARRGCLLSPQQITDGDLIGLRLPRSLIGEPVRPGRALLNTGDGTLRTVAVPLD